MYTQLCIRPISTCLHVHSALQLSVKPERPSTDGKSLQTGVAVTNMAKLGDNRRIINTKDVKNFHLCTPWVESSLEKYCSFEDRFPRGIGGQKI